MKGASRLVTQLSGGLAFGLRARQMREIRPRLSILMAFLPHAQERPGAQRTFLENLSHAEGRLDQRPQCRVDPIRVQTAAKPGIDRLDSVYFVPHRADGMQVRERVSMVSYLKKQEPRPSLGVCRRLEAELSWHTPYATPPSHVRSAPRQHVTRRVYGIPHPPLDPRRATVGGSDPGHPSRQSDTPSRAFRLGYVVLPEACG